MSNNQMVDGEINRFFTMSLLGLPFFHFISLAFMGEFTIWAGVVFTVFGFVGGIVGIFMMIWMDTRDF